MAPAARAAGASQGRAARALAGAVCVTVAGAALLLPFPAGLVERWYAAGIYPRVQRALTPLTNLAPVAILDVLLVAALAWTGWVLVRGGRAAWRARRAGPAAGALWRVLVAAAAAYLVFLALWGLNYRRLPLAARLETAAGPPEAEAVLALGRTAAAEASALHGAAHAEGWPAPPWRTPSLRAAFAETQTLLGDPLPAVPGRLKPTLLGAYFRWTGVDGMVDPFALEALANPDLLPFEEPFVAAHEWAHLAGYADEAEASFLGWLACVRGAAPEAYSGWLFLFAQVQAEIDAAGRAELLGLLDEGPRADLAAVAARQQRAEVPALRRAGWTVYDSYLRANRVEEGVARYGAVITLATRTRFTEGWVPVRRAP